jgi:RpiR family glv operon transcriptional regulator
MDYELLTNKMNDAGTIYLYGTGRAQINVAEEAQRILLTMHKNIIILYDEYYLSSL